MHREALSISTRRKRLPPRDRMGPSSLTNNCFQDGSADGAGVGGLAVGSGVGKIPFGQTNIPFWEESGHEVRICTVTGLRFWSRDPARTTSGDTLEDSYTFIEIGRAHV